MKVACGMRLNTSSEQKCDNGIFEINQVESVEFRKLSPMHVWVPYADLSRLCYRQNGIRRATRNHHCRRIGIA